MPMKTKRDIACATREEIELRLLAFELTERRVALGLSIVLAVVAAVCALRGSPWPLPTGSGLAALGFRGALLQQSTGERDRGEGQQGGRDSAVAPRR